jgi:putative redox protein
MFMTSRPLNAQAPTFSTPLMAQRLLIHLDRCPILIIFSAKSHCGRKIVVMIEANAIWTDAFRFISQATSSHAVVMDADKHSASSPIELVLIGLCGCTGYDVVSILGKKREPLASLEVRAQAERAATQPAVYTEIKLIYRVGGKVSHKAVEDAVRLSEEKYCSVAAMLNKTAKITYEIEYLEE